MILQNLFHFMGPFCLAFTHTNNHNIVLINHVLNMYLFNNPKWNGSESYHKFSEFFLKVFNVPFYFLQVW